MIDWLIVPPRRIYSSPSQLWSYLSPCHLTHLWYLLQNNGHESKMFHRAFITYKIATFQPHLNLPSSILPFSHMPSYSQPPIQIWWSTVSRQRKAQYLERGTLAVRGCICLLGWVNLLRPKTAVALTCLIYDHATHFDEEVADVWLKLQKHRWINLAFLCGRYTAEVFVIYTAAGQLSCCNLWRLEYYGSCKSPPSYGRF